MVTIQYLSDKFFKFCMGLKSLKSKGQVEVQLLNVTLMYLGNVQPLFTNQVKLR